MFAFPSHYAMLMNSDAKLSFLALNYIDYYGLPPLRRVRAAYRSFLHTSSAKTALSFECFRLFKYYTSLLEVVDGIYFN